MALMVRFRAFGRYIYAIGGSEIACNRLGIPVARTKFLIYVLIGLMAGITGIVHGSDARVANPFDLVSSELIVNAAAVLRCTRLSRGHGTGLADLVGVFP